MEEQINSIIDKLKTLPLEQVQTIILELVPILGEEEKKLIFEGVAKELGLDVDYDEEASKESDNNSLNKPGEEDKNANGDNGQLGPTEEQANAMLAQFM